MSGWLEIREPGFHAVLANGALPGTASDDALNQFHARILLNRIVRNADALGTIRRGAHRLGFAPWMKWVSDEDLADYLIAGVASGRLLLEDLEAQEEEEEQPFYWPKNMRPEHIGAFQAAAEHFNVYILVRQTNLASLQHIGQDYALPKPLDCKPKTADMDVVLSSGPKKIAGLVVNPEIVGAAAFNGAKYGKALSEWQRFSKTMIRPEVATLEKQRNARWIVGGRYLVDLDPASERYGAVKLTPTGLTTAAKYVHGDFDLYGIIPAAEPSRNTRVVEERLGQKHARSPEFFDVQHFVNRRIGVPMIQHGAAESYEEEHGDEGIDIFHPDKKISMANGMQELAALYRSPFGSRKLFTKKGAVDIVRGAYVTPA